MSFFRRWRAVRARVVPLSFAHAATIAALHEEAFPRGWSEHDVESLLAGRGVAGLGIRLGTSLLAMALTRVVTDEAELLTLAVAADWRGCGLGTRLLGHVLDAAAREGATRLHLEVEETNPAARALYARAGFVETGRRRGYYRDEGGGDALTLTRRLEDRAPVQRLPPDALVPDAERA